MVEGNSGEQEAGAVCCCEFDALHLFVIKNNNDPYRFSNTVFLSTVRFSFAALLVICVTCFVLFEVRKTRLMLQKIQHLYFLKQATTISCATWQRDTNSFSLPIQVPRIVERLTFFHFSYSCIVPGEKDDRQACFC